FSFSLHDPVLFWFALGLAGAAVLLFYDRLPYISYVVRNLLRKTSWKPDRHKASISLLANFIVWTCVVVALSSLHPHILLANVHFHPKLTYLVAGTLAVLIAVVMGLHYVLRGRSNILLRRLVGLPLRPGLFANFERDRLLRQRISSESWRTSPISLAFTVTDLEIGAGRFFSNRRPEDLAAGQGAD